MNGGWGISHEIALRWMPLDLTDDKSTLVQVMAWCHQATSHYLSQCWLRSMSPNGVTRPQWVNSLMPSDAYICIINIDQHLFREWLGAWLAPSHSLNQCCIIVNWTLRNRLLSNCIWNSSIFIQENAFENVVWKMSAILSGPQYVKPVSLVDTPQKGQWFRPLTMSLLTAGINSWQTIEWPVKWDSLMIMWRQSNMHGYLEHWSMMTFTCD